MLILSQFLLGALLLLLALVSDKGRHGQQLLRALQIVGLALLLGCVATFFQLDRAELAGLWWPFGLALLSLGLFATASVFSDRWRDWLMQHLQAGGACFRRDSARHVTGLVLLPAVVGCSLALSATDASPGDVFDLDLTLTTMLLLLLFALLGAGYPLRRRAQQTRARLGLVAPGIRALLLAAGVGILLVPLMALLWLLWVLVNWPWYAGGDGTVVAPDVTTALLAALMTALGEETLFRGLLQPVFGVALTSVSFALLHLRPGGEIAFVPVLLVSLALAWLRRRHGTVAAIVAHFCYNFTLGLISAWFVF